MKLENKQKTIDKLFNILRNNNNEITKQFFLYNNSPEKKLSENVLTNNSVINVGNNFSIASSTKDQSTLTAYTNETIITEDISDKSKIKNDVNNTINNNQNLDNDVERVRKNAINIESQLKEIRKSMHQRYQNGQRKPNNQNQSECKVEAERVWRKNTTLILGDSIISGIDQQYLSVKGRITKVRSFPGATINDMCDYIEPLLKKSNR